MNSTSTNLNIKPKIQNFLQKKNPYLPYLVILVLASTLTMGIEFLWQDSKDNNPAKSNSPLAEKSRIETADTYIPQGYVLVPIEIANHEALHSLLGQHGIVDLFLPARNPKEKPFRLARQIKLLRAPLNPHRFAVLAREQDSAKFVRLDHPLFAVIKNPKHQTTIKKVETRAKQRRIYIENEEV